MRTKVKLSELKPNPFKKSIQEGRIDQGVVNQIKESMSKTSVWEQWVVREAEEGYEIAFGHHRLKAAIDLLGKDYEVSVQVEKYDDDQMFVALADENAGPEESVEAQCDVVVAARERLLKNPELCKLPHRGAASKTGEQHEHGSERCIAAYLGEENWGKTKVDRLLQLATNFDRSLLRDLTPEQDFIAKQKRIGVNSALELTKLPKRAQKTVLRKAQKARVGFREIKEIVGLCRRRSNGDTHSNGNQSNALDWRRCPEQGSQAISSADWREFRQQLSSLLGARILRLPRLQTNCWIRQKRARGHRRLLGAVGGKAWRLRRRSVQSRGGQHRAIEGAVMSGLKAYEQVICTADLEKLERERNALLDAAKRIWKLLEDGVLVRSIAKDHETDWAIKQIPVAMALAALREAIALTQDGVKP
jgi:ParB-like nuclease domain